MGSLDRAHEAAMFAAGAHSYLDGRIPGRDAAAAVESLCKEAGYGYGYADDERERERGRGRGTWWSRNRGWALPTMVGAGALLLGHDAGMRGRPDRSPLSNVWHRVVERLEALMGNPSSPEWRAATSMGGR